MKFRKTTFADNRANKFEFNELKSFNLDAIGHLIKLKFNEPHVNEHNTTKQVLIFLN